MANTDSDNAAWIVTIEDDTSDSDSDDKNSPSKWICNNVRGFLINNNEEEAYTEYQSAMLAHDSRHRVSNCTIQASHIICPPTMTVSLILY
jgi:hypothetical protein